MYIYNSATDTNVVCCIVKPAPQLFQPLNIVIPFVTQCVRFFLILFVNFNENVVLLEIKLNYLF